MIDNTRIGCHLLTSAAQACVGGSQLLAQRAEFALTDAQDAMEVLPILGNLWQTLNTKPYDADQPNFSSPQKKLTIPTADLDRLKQFCTSKNLLIAFDSLFPSVTGEFATEVNLEEVTVIKSRIEAFSNQRRDTAVRLQNYLQMVNSTIANFHQLAASYQQLFYDLDNGINQRFRRR